jgi:hypothetical protein
MTYFVLHFHVSFYDKRYNKFMLSLNRFLLAFINTVILFIKSSMELFISILKFIKWIVVLEINLFSYLNTFISIRQFNIPFAITKETIYKYSSI